MAAPGRQKSSPSTALLLTFSLIVACIIRSAYAATCYQNLSQKEYPSCMQLEPNFVLYWKTTADGNLVFATDIDGLMEWVSVGVSEAGLRGADYTVAIRGSQAGAWIIGDYFSLDGLSTPQLDLEQNVDLLGATMTGGSGCIYVVLTSIHVALPGQVVPLWQSRNVCVHARRVAQCANMHMHCPQLDSRC